MGAAGRCQLRSEAVTVPGWKPLTCGNVLQQRLCTIACSVRIEGVRGSNPLSSTRVLAGQVACSIFWLSVRERTAQGYTVEKAVADWLEEGLPGRTVKTVEANRDSLRPLLAVIGRIPLKDLTVQDVRTALKKMAATHSTRTLQKGHNCLTRAVRHAEGQDLVRRNVSALVDTPRGLEGRPSQSLTLAEASALLEAAEASRLHAFIVLCLLTGVRSEEARALTWEHVDLEAGTISVWRSVRAHGDTKTNRSRRTLKLPEIAVEALRGQRERQAGSGPRPGSCGRSMGWCSPRPWGRGMSRITCGGTSGG